MKWIAFIFIVVFIVLSLCVQDKNEATTIYGDQTGYGTIIYGDQTGYGTIIY